MQKVDIIQRLLFRKQFPLDYFRQKSKRLSVVLCRPINSDSFPMCFSRISLVRVPCIFGMFFCQIIHKLIPVCFCQNGSGGDGQIFSVAFDDAMMWDSGKRPESVAVDEQGGRF